ncbi:hypothetical protein RCO28_06365 [Streptomyces sp. LHD-70]|nr:hypothetical protein [Streptomyces sp. LHD-70]MDQ8702116.1 hypothetical protein [Streptomyces sp. LHD-70]
MLLPLSARLWAEDLSAPLQFQDFDAGSPAARQLLERLRGCVAR